MFSTPYFNKEINYKGNKSKLLLFISYYLIFLPKVINIKNSFNIHYFDNFLPYKILDY